MIILVAILCLALSACVESQPALPKPTVYEWRGTGPYPSPERLAQDRIDCAQDADQTYPREVRRLTDRWKAQEALCMKIKGWAQKAID